MWTTLEGKFDILVPDHRGTGFSERMDDYCDRALGTRYTLLECLDVVRAEYGGDEKIRSMSVSNAARDVIAVMNNISMPGEAIYVYGVSYGTYLGQRILLFEDEVVEGLAGVVLDGLCAYSQCDIIAFNRNFDLVGIRG